MSLDSEEAYHFQYPSQYEKFPQFKELRRMRIGGDEKEPPRKLPIAVIENVILPFLVMSAEEIDQAVKSLDLRQRKNAELSMLLGGVKQSEDVTDWAAHEGHLDIVQWLWEKGIHATVEGANGAAWEGHLNVIQWLWAQGVQATADWAARKGHLDVVQWLWEKGVQVTIRGADWASSSGHLDVVQWLETRGIHSSDEDEDGDD